MNMLLYWRSSLTTPLLPKAISNQIMDDCVRNECFAEPYILNVEVSENGMRYTFSDGRVAEISSVNKIYKP
jgi:hypothetical protein